LTGLKVVDKVHTATTTEVVAEAINKEVVAPTMEAVMETGHPQADMETDHQEVDMGTDLLTTITGMKATDLMTGHHHTNQGRAATIRGHREIHLIIRHKVINQDLTRILVMDLVLIPVIGTGTRN